LLRFVLQLERYFAHIQHQLHLRLSCYFSALRFQAHVNVARMSSTWSELFFTNSTNHNLPLPFTGLLTVTSQNSDSVTLVATRRIELR
jgi:hypothetical protein